MMDTLTLVRKEYNKVYTFGYDQSMHPKPFSTESDQRTWAIRHERALMFQWDVLLAHEIALPAAADPATEG